VTEGLRLFADGKPLAGQLWFGEAIRRNPEDDTFLNSHRLRMDLYDRFFRRYRPGAMFVHDDEILHLAFSPDGKRVVTASSDKTARVWDAETGRPLCPSLEHKNSVRSASFSPDGRRVITGSGDKTARIWDVESGKPLTPPMEHESAINVAAFSRD